MASEAWVNDPKRLLFMLARYKFVAKMLAGTSGRVVEIGACDGWAARIVQQSVYQVTVTDADMDFIRSYNPIGKWDRPGQQWNPLNGPMTADKFDAAYALDVLEHIRHEDESVFMQNIVDSLTNDGVFIVGMPSLESQKHASEKSKQGHVNCKNGKELQALMRTWFRNAFLFSMNDEVLHTGFEPMSHYLLCVGSVPRR